MNMLAFGVLALWPTDAAVVLLEPVTIPVAAMVRRQREAAVNDIRLRIQADLERSTMQLLKQKRSRWKLHQQPTALASTKARDRQ